MASTEVELINVLEASLTRKNKTAVRRIMVKAKQGHYHDFKSNMMMPKVTLIRDLQQVGLVEIADRVRDGEFDEEYPSPEQERHFNEVLRHGTPARA